MSTDPNTIMSATLPSPLPFPGVGTGEHHSMTNNNMSAGSVHTAQLDDPRWTFAMRARLVLERDQVQIGQIDALRDFGLRAGLNPMQIGSIIGSIERSIMRGGFDKMAHDEIMKLPEAKDGVAMLSSKARWMTFGVLFVWALSIAGLMQLVASA